MLDGDDGSLSPDSQDIQKRLTVQFKVFWLFGAWTMNSCTLLKHRATITTFTSFYINFEYYFSVITT